MRFQRARLLVVDDAPSVRWLVCQLLREAGFRYVEEARGPAEALERLTERHFDLIITAWEMEPISGEGLVNLVRRWPQLRGTAVLALTCAEKHDALRGGADAAVCKPFRIAELLGQVVRQVMLLPSEPRPGVEVQAR